MSRQFTDKEMIAIKDEEIAQQRTINMMLKHELATEKARADHWRGLVDMAFRLSREACFTPTGTKFAREKRDNLLGEINHRLGGAIR